MQLYRHADDIRSAGASLTLIGQATPRHATHFRRKLEIDLPVLADEDRDSYKAAGAKVATLTELLGPASVGRGALKTLKGQRQGRVIGHPAQLGGVFVVRPDGEVAWSHMSDDPSDLPSTDELVAAVRKAAGAAG